MPLLTTKRLVIRKITLNDAPFILELINDKDWISNIGDRNVKTIEEAEAYISETFLKTYQESSFGFYGVAIKNSGQLIGTVGLIDREGIDHVDVGYGLLPAYRGKGYAIEATKAMYNYGYDTLSIDKIVAIVNPDNDDSIKLLKKLGLTFEKMVKLPDEEKDIKLFS